MKKITDLILYNDPILPKEGEIGLSNDYLLKPEINPYLIYIVLKEKFGTPNSDMIDEDKQQWEWTFAYKDFFISIYDWKLLSTSIAIYHNESDSEKSKVLAETINSLLEKEASQRKARIRNIIKGAKHKILENPFMIYYSTAESLLELSTLLDDFTTRNITQAKDITNIPPTWFNHLEKKADLYRSTFLMLLSSFEGFMNILYELYLKVDLRADRLYERIGREQIDIKLRIAPIYCDGFKVKTINHDDVRFKNYLRLVNLRNDYVHANLVKTLERYVYQEDNFTFIVENEEQSEIPSNINQLELEHVLIAKKYIDEVVDFVIESFDTKTKREFKNIIFQTTIEVIDEDGVLIPV